LRQVIRKSVQQQTSLLHSISTSEMEYQIQRNVMNLVRKFPASHEPQSSLEEEDIMQYIDQVVSEIKQHKNLESGSDKEK
jgi:hypothetical protein